MPLMVRLKYQTLLILPSKSFQRALWRVIIDMAAGSGGNCELTQKDETIIHKQVRIIGNSNYPSKMPADASKMLGKNYLNFLDLMINDDGQLSIDFDDEILKNTCMTRDGEITNERVREIISLEEV